MRTTGTGPPASELAAEPLPRRRLIFAVVSIGLLMVSMDATIVASALPAIQHDLGTKVAWSGWTITIYALGQMLTLPVAGRLSDHFGRKTVFLSGAALFTVTSLCCYFVGNIATLVVLRAIQAIGGGAFMPSATGIIADNFGKGRDRALGMFTSILPIGGILGPLVGGLITEYWSWRNIFLVNVPAGIALILLGARFLPASKPRQAGRVDVGGILLLAVLVVSSMFGIAWLGDGRVSLLNPVFLISEVIALVTVVVFVRHSKRHEDPFIPFELMRGRGFGAMNVINVVVGACAIGFGTLVPLYAQTRFGMGYAASGTLLAARSVGSIGVATLSTLALRRTGHRMPMAAGFCCSATGMAAMFFVPSGVSPYVWLSIAAGITGFGNGLTLPASNNAILQLAPEKAAAIAGLRGMFRQAGAIIAISIATAIIARSVDPGMTQAHVFLAFALLPLLMLPLLRFVPDHRGSW